MNREVCIHGPCINDMCPLYDCEYIMNCTKASNSYLTESYQIAEAKCCKKYITEKPESVWERFRRLEGQHGHEFHKLLFETLFPRYRFKDQMRYDAQRTVAAELLFKPEQEANNILNEVEKELSKNLDTINDIYYY